jgi:hypothetical protein
LVWYNLYLHLTCYLQNTTHSYCFLSIGILRNTFKIWAFRAVYKIYNHNVILNNMNIWYHVNTLWRSMCFKAK